MPFRRFPPPWTQLLILIDCASGARPASPRRYRSRRRVRYPLIRRVVATAPSEFSATNSWVRGGQRQALCLFTPSVALAAHLPSTTFTGIGSDGHNLVSRLRASRRLSLPKFNCATVNREALRARRKVIAGLCRQSSGPGGYSVKTVRELSVGGPCITLGFVLRETASRISYRDRHGTSKIHQQTLGGAHRAMPIMS
jgi:hypothetical protein